MREEQDCDASAAQSANFRVGELVAFADARSGGTNLAIEYHDFIAKSIVALEVNTRVQGPRAAACRNWNRGSAVMNAADQDSESSHFGT